MSSFPLSASVVSVEDMDRQPLSSPEGKKVSYPSLSLSLFSPSHFLTPTRRWRGLPAGRGALRSVLQSEQTMPESVWRPAWHPKDPGELWAQAAGASWESILRAADDDVVGENVSSWWALACSDSLEDELAVNWMFFNFRDLCVTLSSLQQRSFMPVSKLNEAYEVECRKS